MEVKLGLVQMRMSQRRDKNLEKATGMVRRLAEEGAQIVCLPELFDSPYFPQEQHAGISAETIPNRVTEALSRAAEENRVVLVGGSVFERFKGRSYNTSLVFDEHGNELGRYRKVHIPQDPSFYEQDYFAPGSDYKVFETHHGKVAVLICFDQWYPEPARISKLLGAQILFYPTAIGTVKGVEQVEGSWRDAWETVQRGHAIANSVVVAAVNRVGAEKDMRFWGGSFVCDQFGKVLARADAKEQVLAVTCDLKLGEDIERGWGFMRNRRPGTYKEIVKP
jgi:predicted amidohydrolase